MAAIMSQVFSNRFPGLSIADIRQAMQNTEANMLPSPPSRLGHPDNLDHLRGDGNESDSDVSVGQENDDCLSDEVQNENSSADSSSIVSRSKRASVDFSEETSNDSRCFSANRISSPGSEAAPAAPPVLRPSPTRLHEEFIRSSQIYAEELMRQQMSIVAATQKISVFPKLAAVRPHLVANESLTSFRGIHNHLNAISQITQNLNHDMYKHLTSPTSPESSQSPPIHPHHHLMNNNLHDQNLKFGIDNILKADFGRRITEPLKRKGSAKKRRLSPDRAAVDLSREEKDDAGSHKSASSPAPKSPGNAGSATESTEKSSSGGPMVWPAWVYCTRYSDRPSSGRSPRTRKPKKTPSEKSSSSSTPEDKRPRTAFSGPQLARLKHEFAENRYLTERRRQQLSAELGLNEAQIKIWFQNKRAKIKKSSGHKNPLALQLMAQGLYNHSTVPLTREEEELQELQAQAAAAGKV